jgi:ankyrin repeat protein
MKKNIAFALLFLLASAPIESAEIHQAVMSGDLSRVKTILEKNPALVDAMEEGLTPIYYAAYQNDKKMVNFLLSKGAKDSIFIATIIGDAAKVKVFLGSNPSLIHQKDQSGQTCLHWAANKGHLQIVKLLVSQGAQVNLKDKTGWTPLEYAAEMKRKEIVKYLKSHGAE